MPVFRQSIVNNYCVQIVRSLFFFYVGFFEYLFNMLNFFFQDINLILCSVFKSFQYMLGYLNLLNGHTKLTLRQLLWIKEIEMLVLNTNFLTSFSRIGLFTTACTQIVLTCLENVKLSSALLLFGTSIDLFSWLFDAPQFIQIP